MNTYFVPYLSDQPLTLHVKGHKLLICGTSYEDLYESLRFLGADELRAYNTTEEEDDALCSLAETINGGVILAPDGMEISSVLKNLEAELPWVN